MINLNSYENFLGINEMYDVTVNEDMHISEEAKQAIKTICEGLLCKEALDYENDPDDSHTYEKYSNECAGYLKEVMGQSGYSGLMKHQTK
jgi:hypothetical protein